ncbi:MAG: sterol desaturase family protein [Leptospiraceae bacterium]|nr:sterol desaturase family protein [Leptospiraceae bacterium]
MDTILQYTIEIRLFFFIGLFVLFAAWEILLPDHISSYSRKSRWTWNLILVVLNNFFIRILLPVSALGMAEYVTRNRIGFLNKLDFPEWLLVIVGVIFLDFVIYIQHILFHSLPLLWKLHQMHHADLELDVTSGTRFHPIEILISMLIKFSAIILSGVNPFTVLLFEIILNGMAMFNHSNIYIPKSIDNILRYILITPSLHRIHHSILSKEYNSNYGFNLSIWDRLMGTLKVRHEGNLIIGLPFFRDKKFLRLDWMLKIPVLKLERPLEDLLFYTI